MHDKKCVLRKKKVVIARGIHFFPFRTESLSPSAPMVLVPKTGRVGRRLFNTNKARSRKRTGFCCFKEKGVRRSGRGRERVKWRRDSAGAEHRAVRRAMQHATAPAYALALRVGGRCGHAIKKATSIPIEAAIVLTTLLYDLNPKKQIKRG